MTGSLWKLAKRVSVILQLKKNGTGDKRGTMGIFAIISLFAVGAEPTHEPLQIQPATADRGEVKAGAPLQQTFTLRNNTAAELRITDIAAGCGCLRPRITKRTLQPGESVDLSVEINTLAQSAGPNAWKVTVHFVQGPDGQTTSGSHELVIKARVVREIDVEPIALFLSVDGEAMHTISVTDRRERPLKITGVGCDAKFVRTQLLPASEASPRRRQIQVHLSADCPAGHHSETIVVQTDDPAYRELRIPLIIVRKAPGQIQATPEQLDLRLTKGQKAASGLVRLRDPDDKQIVVEKLEADHPALRFKWAIGPGSMATLRLGVEFPDAPTSGLGSVTIHLKEPKKQVIIIPVAWQAP
jgi:hypothetical protein